MDKEYKPTYKQKLFYFLMAGGIGLLTGAIDAFFGRVLLAVSAFRDLQLPWLLPFLPLGGLLTVFLYQKFGKNSSKGMGLLFSIGHDGTEEIPKRMLPLVTVSTWLTHLFGGSAGREGVAVQIGATVGYTMGKKLKYPDAKKTFLLVGMAAGFAGLFETPMAAVFFALEVLMAGALNYQALFPALIASFVAAGTSWFLQLEKFSVALDTTGLILDWTMGFKLILLGLVFSAAGYLFTKVLHFTKDFLARRWPDPYRRIALVSLLLVMLLFIFHSGRYSGLGTNLISASFTEGPIYGYDWLLKIGLTVLTLAAGFQGGEVTPLFSVGASLGYWVAPWFGLPVEFVAALGYASVFASATNTLLAPIFIGVEVFGYENLPFFFIVVAVAYVCNQNALIYSGQKLLDL